MNHTIQLVWNCSTASPVPIVQLCQERAFPFNISFRLNGTHTVNDKSIAD